jgi:hypothetical protein
LLGMGNNPRAPGQQQRQRQQPALLLTVPAPKVARPLSVPPCAGSNHGSRGWMKPGHNSCLTFVGPVELSCGGGGSGGGAITACGGVSSDRWWSWRRKRSKRESGMVSGWRRRRLALRLALCLRSLSSGLGAQYAEVRGRDQDQDRRHRRITGVEQPIRFLLWTVPESERGVGL